MGICQFATSAMTSFKCVAFGTKFPGSDFERTDCGQGGSCRGNPSHYRGVFFVSVLRDLEIRNVLHYSNIKELF